MVQALHGVVLDGPKRRLGSFRSLRELSAITPDPHPMQHKPMLADLPRSLLSLEVGSENDVFP